MIQSWKDAQHAAKLVETDGAEAYGKVAKLYGPEVALVLVITHLRRDLGSMDGFPSNPDIDTKVETALREHNIPFHV